MRRRKDFYPDQLPFTVASVQWGEGLGVRGERRNIMTFYSWRRSRTSTQSPRAHAQHRPVAPRFRPRLEALEGRWVPSTLTVTNNLDSGPGSLRVEIAAANSG